MKRKTVLFVVALYLVVVSVGYATDSTASQQKQPTDSQNLAFIETITRGLLWQDSVEWSFSTQPQDDGVLQDVVRRNCEVRFVAQEYDPASHALVVAHQVRDVIFKLERGPEGRWRAAKTGFKLPDTATMTIWYGNYNYIFSCHKDLGFNGLRFLYSGRYKALGSQ